MTASGDIDVQLWMTESGQQLTGDNTGMSAEDYPVTESARAHSYILS